MYRIGVVDVKGKGLFPFTLSVNIVYFLLSIAYLTTHNMYRKYAFEIPLTTLVNNCSTFSFTIKGR